MTKAFGLGWLFPQRRQPARRAGRPLRVEMLESKLPLAGNITAVLAGNQLTLTGDAASNAMYLTGTGGNVRVTGQGATINGAATRSFTGVSTVLIFDNGGSDIVTATNLSLAGELFMSLDSGGVGNDVVSLTNVNVGGSLLVRTDPINQINDLVNSSAGADVVTIYNVVVGNEFFLETGGTGGLAGIRGDVVTVNRLTANNLINGGQNQISTGGGSDVITVIGSTIKQELVIRSDLDFANSTGIDRITVTTTAVTGDLVIIADGSAGGGTAADYVTLNTVTSSESLILTTSGGNDVTAIANSSFGTPPTGAFLQASQINVGAAAGADRDTLTITGTSFLGGLNLSTGADADYVYVATSRFVGPGVAGLHTVVNLGAGNDIMYVVACTFDDPLRLALAGGAGTDRFYATANKTTLGAKIVFPSAAAPDVEFFYST